MGFDDIYSKSECEKWIRDKGVKNPKSNMKIDPNNTKKTSKNVLISDQCFDNFGIIRNGNPYDPKKKIQKKVKNNKQTNMKRRSDVNYLNQNNKIKIDKYAFFDFYQLKRWWQEGVMKKNDDFHLINPLTNRKISENSTIYNALLQQSDIFCFIPINLEFLEKEGYLSIESVEILKLLRKNVQDENWTSITLKQKFPYLPREGYIQKIFRDTQYDKYIYRYNIKERINKNFTEGSLVDLESLENNSISKETSSVCVSKFKSIDNKYKLFRNKLIKTCTNQQNMTNLSDNQITIMFKTFKPDPIYRYDIINVINFPSLISLFYNCIKDPSFGAKIFDNKIKVDNYELYNEILFEKSIVQDYGGVSNQMITNISRELFDLQVFIRPYDCSKYCFNPEFAFTPEHISYLTKMNNFFEKDIDKKNEFNEFISRNDEAIYQIFYKFIGQLLSFFMIKKYKLPHHLSSYILNTFKFKYNKMKGEEHVFFISNDFPEVTKVYLDLMKSENKSELNNIDMYYNEQYKIQYDKDDGDKITVDNIDKYIVDLAKHLNIHNTIPVFKNQNINIDFENYHRCFADGIDKILRRLFQYKNASLDLIDKILTKEEITNEVLSKLSDNIFQYITVDDVDYIRYIQVYHSYINNIFFKEHRFKSQEDRVTFIKNLLQFWTGIDFYKPEIKYNLNIISRSKKLDIDNRRLPVSHTCFNQIEIDIYETEDEFFNKLSKAINYTKNTFTLAGGKKNGKK